MTGKLEFGCDYLDLMRWLETQGSKNMDPVTDTAVRLLLLQWDFTLEEIDEANKQFWERLNAGTLPNDLLTVAKRITDYIKDDKTAQERLIIELAAIGYMDMNVNNGENTYVTWFQDLLDIKPSEFQALCTQGMNWAIGLNFFGNEYANSKRQG